MKNLASTGEEALDLRYLLLRITKGACIVAISPFCWENWDSEQRDNWWRLISSGDRPKPFCTYHFQLIPWLGDIFKNGEFNFWDYLGISLYTAERTVAFSGQ